MRRNPLFMLHEILVNYIFDSYSLSFAQALPRGGDSPQEAGVVFEAIIKPVLFGFKTDQNSGRLPVPHDDDFFIFRKTEEFRQLIFDFRQRYCFHAVSPYRSSQLEAWLLGMIAKTSTSVSLIS